MIGQDFLKYETINNFFFKVKIVYAPDPGDGTSLGTS